MFLNSHFFCLISIHSLCKFWKNDEKSWVVIILLKEDLQASPSISFIIDSAIFSRSIFISFYLGCKIVGVDTGCKLNKSTFTGDCARAFEIENIRHFRQSQFIRRHRPLIRTSNFPRIRRWPTPPPSGKTRFCSNDRFTVKFTGKFASAAYHGISLNGIWKIYFATKVGADSGNF